MVLKRLKKCFLDKSVEESDTVHVYRQCHYISLK